MSERRAHAGPGRPGGKDFRKPFRGDAADCIDRNRDRLTDRFEEGETARREAGFTGGLIDISRDEIACAKGDGVHGLIDSMYRSTERGAAFQEGGLLLFDLSQQGKREMQALTGEFLCRARKEVENQRYGRKQCTDAPCESKVIRLSHILLAEQNGARMLRCDALQIGQKGGIGICFAVKQMAIAHNDDPGEIHGSALHAVHIVIPAEDGLFAEDADAVGRGDEGVVFLGLWELDAEL